MVDKAVNIVVKKLISGFVFQENNIKIHFNSDEYGLSNVIRQISISKLNGCSIGKCRLS